MTAASRLARAAIAVAIAACGPAPRDTMWSPSPWARSGESAPASTGPVFQLAGDAASPATVELAGESRKPYHYVLHLEASGVTSDLDAAIISGDVAYAAGADGVVLRRAAAGPWERVATPTTRRLRALVVDGEGGAAVGSGDLVAAGDGGTVLRRAATGAWTVEPVPTSRDLYDLAWSDGRLYAVGDGGTLVVRDAGAWRAIATHTTADLRRFDGRVAIGAGGVILDCTPWDRDQHDLARQLACVPRPSPTDRDLLADIGDERHSAWHAWGAVGTSLAAARYQPIDVTAAPALPGEPTITAAADNHWSTTAGELATIVVGERGAIGFVDRSGVTRMVTLAGAPDLRGVATAQLDAFVVGAHGTIVHLQTTDVSIPQVMFAALAQPLFAGFASFE